MCWLIPLRFARVLLPEGEECVGSSPFASLGYFSRREKKVWLPPSPVALGAPGDPAEMGGWLATSLFVLPPSSEPRVGPIGPTRGSLS